jgi:hypothetical protein
VAWKAGMASGLFCVTRPGHLELRLEAYTHQGVEGFVLDLHAVRLSHPLAQGLIGGESCCAVEGLFKTCEDGRRERDGLTRGEIGRQQGVQAPVA